VFSVIYHHIIIIVVVIVFTVHLFVVTVSLVNKDELLYIIYYVYAARQITAFHLNLALY